MSEFDEYLKPDRRVEPVSRPTVKVIGKNCRKCGEYFQQDMYIPSKAWFFPDGM